MREEGIYTHEARETTETADTKLRWQHRPQPRCAQDWRIVGNVIVLWSGNRKSAGSAAIIIVRSCGFSLAMIVALAARNLKFPVKFPVSREFDV